MTVHPAIRLASAARLGTISSSPLTPRPAGDRRRRARDAVRRAGGAVLDRVGDRAAVATGARVAELADELARVRAELRAEVELLRAELEARDADGRS